MNRAQWKIYYRSLRSIKREMQKAQVDLVLYGTYALYIGPDGVRHVPLSEVHI